jgi:hypothetical protein
MRSALTLEDSLMLRKRSSADALLDKLEKQLDLLDEERKYRLNSW